MSEPIKVGDLVVVIRPGCSDQFVGRIFAVVQIKKMTGVCDFCKTTHGYGLGSLMAYEDYSNTGWELGRLRRIPPLAELDSIERKEETPA